MRLGRGEVWGRGLWRWRGRVDFVVVGGVLRSFLYLGGVGCFIGVLRNFFVLEGRGKKFVFWFSFRVDFWVVWGLFDFFWVLMLGVFWVFLDGLV